MVSISPVTGIILDRNNQSTRVQEVYIYMIGVYWLYLNSFQYHLLVTAGKFAKL